MKTQTRYEFSTFKCHINLPTFATMFGYEVDRKKTTKTSIAMKSGNDKVIISKKGGVWVYFSVFNDDDSGTIVDFVGNRSSKSIPEIGELLADWSGLGSANLPVYDIENRTYDQERVKLIFSKCKPIENSEYLGSRGLGNDLLQSGRFAGRLFVDRHGNVAFPHYHDGQICGLELKNEKRGLLVKGSQKTFWRSNTKRIDRTLVVTESVIDSLSYQQLFQLNDAMYITTGGGVSTNQERLLSDMLISAVNIENVLIATDNDAGGDRIADRISRAIDKSGFSGEIIRHCPSQEGDDWNDALLRDPKSATLSFPLPRDFANPKFGIGLSEMANGQFPSSST